MPAAEGPATTDPVAFLAEFEASQKAAATDPPAEPSPDDKTDPIPPPEGEPKPAEPEPVAAKPPDPSDEQRRATKALAAASKLHAKALEKSAAADAVLAKAKQFDELQKLPMSQRLKLIGAPDIKAVADALLAEGDEPAAPTPADEVAELRKRLDAREASEKAAEQARLVEAVRGDVFKRISDTPGDRFELIKAHGEKGLELVWETAAEFLAANGRAPDPLEVVDAVEADYLADAIAATSANKFKARAGAAVPANTSRAAAPQQPLPGATTLTTKDGPEVPSSDELPMDPDERHARIMRDIARGASA